MVTKVYVWLVRSRHGRYGGKRLRVYGSVRKGVDFSYVPVLGPLILVRDTGLIRLTGQGLRTRRNGSEKDVFTFVFSDTGYGRTAAVGKHQDVPCVTK